MSNRSKLDPYGIWSVESSSSSGLSWKPLPALHTHVLTIRGRNYVFRSEDLAQLGPYLLAIQQNKPELDALLDQMGVKLKDIHGTPVWPPHDLERLGDVMKEER